MTKKTVLVTGAASGIGAACAVAFGEAGDNVVACYHSKSEDASGTADAVEKAGGTVLIQHVEVEKEESVDAAFAAAEAKFGRVSVLVNSAGINMAGIPVREMTFDRWQKMIGTDLGGAFLTSRRFLKGLGDDGAGASIIQISSIHADVVRAGGSDYDAAKAGVNKFVQTLAVEEGARNIRVNAIEPGMILTPMNEKAMDDEAYRKSLEKNIPMKRAGMPAEVGWLARWLASDEAAYITGATIRIDGGLSLLLGQGA